MNQTKNTEPERNWNNVAIALLFIIIACAVAVYLVAANYPDIFDNLFGEYGTGEIEIGDCVDVHYIGMFAGNGTVFDTSYEDAATKTGGEPLQVFVNPNRNLTAPEGYETYQFDMVDGFLKGLLGLKEGDSQNLTVPPDEAYGTWNVTMGGDYLELFFGTKYWPRFSRNNFTEVQTKSQLMFLVPDIDNVTVGDTYDYINGTSPTGENVTWQILITNISGENVTIQHLVENGTIIDEVLWNSTVIIENETSFILRTNPVIGSTFSSFGYTPFHTKVIDFNETEIILAINMQAPSLAFIGETLIFEIEIVKVYKCQEES